MLALPLKVLSKARRLRLITRQSQKAEPPKPIEEFPIMGVDLLTRVKQHIVVELFQAIRREDSETVALLIQNNLVTANTSESGRTPLLEAISTKVVHLVKELLEFGADPNAFGIVVRLFLLSNPYLKG
jgi:ankyrin repeat protein